MSALFMLVFVFLLVYFLVNHDDGKGDRRSADQIGRDGLHW